MSQRDLKPDNCTATNEHPKNYCSECYLKPNYGECRVGTLSVPVDVLGWVPKWVGWGKWEDKFTSSLGIIAVFKDNLIVFYTIKYWRNWRNKQCDLIQGIPLFQCLLK